MPHANTVYAVCLCDLCAQEKAIPLAMEGKDILARAKTGSGKTAVWVHEHRGVVRAACVHMCTLL